MKAIIMAGGEGTRLRPVNSGIPKPMVSMLERPLLKHIVRLLKEYGITEICTTLGYRPKDLIDYFGDGSRFGVNITHHVEKVALGTAGGVRACKDFVGNEDFLVISGDAACDFDLCELIYYHNYHKPAVTMALFSHLESLQYGLVLTDKEGNVRTFIEKPTWERVVTDNVNTGIYILSGRVMDYIPNGEFYDFAKDLFPYLMRRGETIRAVALDGYWCDIGNPSAYLRCVTDALDGKLQIMPGVPQARPGVWSGSPIPLGVKIVPPCVIGENVVMEAGCVIGPRAVVGKGSKIGTGAKIQSSVVDGAVVGADADVSGAIICRGANLPEDMILEPGDVLAAHGAQYPPDPKMVGISTSGPGYPNSANSESSRQTNVSMGERSPIRVPMPYSKELDCAARARVMRVLSESLVEFGADFTDGLNITTELGKVRISPSPNREAIVVETDAGVFSKGLCAEYENLVRAYVEDEDY